LLNEKEKRKGRKNFIYYFSYNAKRQYDDYGDRTASTIRNKKNKNRSKITIYE